MSIFVRMSIVVIILLFTASVKPYYQHAQVNLYQVEKTFNGSSLLNAAQTDYAEKESQLARLKIIVQNYKRDAFSFNISDDPEIEIILENGDTNTVDIALHLDMTTNRRAGDEMLTELLKISKGPHKRTIYGYEDGAQNQGVEISLYKESYEWLKEVPEVEDIVKVIQLHSASEILLKTPLWIQVSTRIGNNSLSVRMGDADHRLSKPGYTNEGLFFYKKLPFSYKYRIKNIPIKYMEKVSKITIKTINGWTNQDEF